MGNESQYLKMGGFSAYLYEDHKDFEPVTINGIRAKVLHYIPDNLKDHTGLPKYANTSDMYFRVGPDGTVVQGKYYINRKHCLDFDWGHRHTNKKGDGKTFPEGTVHVQEYSVTDGKVRFSHKARLMTDAEIEKFGPIILHFNPNVKFRP